MKRSSQIPSESSSDDGPPALVSDTSSNEQDSITRVYKNPSPVGKRSVSWALLYNPKAIGEEFISISDLEICHRNLSIFELKKHQVTTRTNRSNQDVSHLYMHELDDYRLKLNNQMFDGFNASTKILSRAKVTWLGLSGNFSTFELNIPSLKRLGSMASLVHNFPDRSRSSGANNSVLGARYMHSIIDCYNTVVLPNDEIRWFSKAAWLIFHLCKSAICKNNILNALLLANWSILQQNIPFPVAFNFEEMDEETETRFYSALTSDCEIELAIWIAKAISTQWTNFERIYANAVRGTSGEVVNGGMGGVSFALFDGASLLATEERPSALSAPLSSPSTTLSKLKAPPTKSETIIDEAMAQKLISNHRKHLKTSETCFICLDDSVRPSISMLCCGLPTHVKCVYEWYSRKHPDGEEQCPGCRQANEEPDVNIPDSASDVDGLLHGVMEFMNMAGFSSRGRWDLPFGMPVYPGPRSQLPHQRNAGRSVAQERDLAQSSDRNAGGRFDGRTSAGRTSRQVAVRRVPAHQLGQSPTAGGNNPNSNAAISNRRPSGANERRGGRTNAEREGGRRQDAQSTRAGRGRGQINIMTDNSSFTLLASAQERQEMLRCAVCDSLPLEQAMECTYLRCYDCCSRIAGVCQFHANNGSFP